MNKLLVICGPTATGKTSLAIRLAQKFRGEYVSADSRQIYKGLDIITGKDIPKKHKAENAKLKVAYRNRYYVIPEYIVDKVPFWMYDIIEPRGDFSVAHYYVLARAVIQDVWKRNALPIIVGGTGLYINALIKPFSTIDIPQNIALRKELVSYSVLKLQEKLKNIDFSRYASMNKSDSKNPRRLIRAIEVALWMKVHGKEKDKKALHCQIRKIGLSAPFSVLSDRIFQRVRARFCMGAAKEAALVLQKGVSNDMTSATALGLSIMSDYLGKKLTRKEALLRWHKAEFAYAKRQLTWFKKDNGILWFDISCAQYEMHVEEEVMSWYTRENFGNNCQ